MLSNGISKQIRLGYKILAKLSEQGLLFKPFRAKEVKDFDGHDLTTLERFGLIECVSRETEKIEIQTESKTYFVKDEFGRKTQDLRNLSDYRTYTLIAECETKTVNSKYKVYRVAKTYDQFIQDLKESALREIDSEREYITKRMSERGF